MKKVSVKVKTNLTKTKVGDTVEFQVGLETIRDKVTYTDATTIEGEKYDLTNVRFTIVR
jgi:uncharacterized protein YkvS